MRIVSVFVQPRNNGHNRPSYIYVGRDDASMVKASWNLLNSGFYLMKGTAQLQDTNPISSLVEADYTPISGKQIWIRRDRAPTSVSNAWYKICWHEMRVYQTPNLL